MTVVKGKVTDGNIVLLDEPLPPGQDVFVVTSLDAESLLEIAQKLTEQGKPEEAFRLLREHESVVYERFVHPFVDAIVSPLLK